MTSKISVDSNAVGQHFRANCFSFVITARKGYVFTGVCHFPQMRGCPGEWGEWLLWGSHVWLPPGGGACFLGGVKLLQGGMVRLKRPGGHDMVAWGGHPGRGCAWLPGGHVWFSRGGMAALGWDNMVFPMRYGERAGGTHPTGILSLFYVIVIMTHNKLIPLFSHISDKRLWIPTLTFEGDVTSKGREY